MPTTTDLSKFGFRELKMLEELLHAMRKQGLPEDFNMAGVHPMMNQVHRTVFLTNEHYEVAMMNGDKLESFYSCPYCGHEGFLEEMEHDAIDEECTEYMARISK